MDQKFKIIDPLEDSQWDRLIADYENSTLFHTSHWARVLKESYGYRPGYITLQDGNNLLLGLPMMEVASGITGKRGVSLPFTDYCEPILRPGIGFSELIEFLSNIGKSFGWKFFELRDYGKYLPHEPISDSYYGHVLELKNEPQDVFKNFKDSTKRNIKKAGRGGVEISIEYSLDSVKAFYRLNCLTRRMHGLPPQPFYFFKKIFEHILMKKQGIIILAWYRGKCIAGAMYFHFGDKALYKYGASDRKYQHLRPNNLIMWEAIQHYCLSGFKQFDFGRTEEKNSGLMQFKAGWGAQARIIKYYRYNLKSNYFIPKDSRNKNGQIFTKIFNRLPLYCLRVIGTLAYRHIG